MRKVLFFLLKDNPVFVILLGLCPTLAVSTNAQNGLGMGIAATVVLIASNFLISLIRPITIEQIRIPIFITIIASFVTILELLMKAFLPELHASLGIFIPLIVVNCIILGRAEAFASKNNIWSSVMDGLQKGLAFTFALFVLGSIREIFGGGSWLGLQVLPESYPPMLILILPPGAFFILGLMIAVVNYLLLKEKTST